MKKAEAGQKKNSGLTKGKWASCLISVLCLLYLPPASSAATLQILPPSRVIHNIAIFNQIKIKARMPVKVPDIRNMSLRKASSILKKHHLKIEITQKIFHPKSPPGHIVSQIPRPGKAVPEKATIEVTISKGPALMPDLKGKKWRTAVEILSGKHSRHSTDFTRYHLKIVKKDVISDRGPDIVVDQTPGGGVPIPYGTTVTLYVSHGLLSTFGNTHGNVSNSLKRVTVTPTLPVSQVTPAHKPSNSTLKLHSPYTLNLTSRSFRLKTKWVTQNAPIPLCLENDMSHLSPSFYLGRHKVPAHRSGHSHKILLSTRGIPAGNYPLVAQVHGKKTLIGRIRIIKVHKSVSLVKLHSSEPTLKKHKNVSKTVSKSQTKTHHSPSPVPVSHPKKRRIKFIFTVSAQKLPRLKDILLKETPWMRIVRVRRLRSLRLTIVSVEAINLQRSKKTAERLLARRIIRNFQPSHTYRTYGTEGDPFASRQYGCQPIQNLLKIQARCTGCKIHVALLDTGVDIYHEDLNEKTIEKVDFTGEGLGRFLTDIHGTALCGIIAAIPNNGKGILGLAPGVKLHIIKVCKRVSPSAIEATTDSFTFAEGLDYAIRKRVHIINVSIGGPRDRIIEKLIRKALSSGIIVVAAVGNGGPHSPPTYPAAYPGVIGVTAIDQDLQLYPQAARGRFVDIAAPGVDVFSLKPGNRYNFYTGTSFATAYVTGILALKFSCCSNKNRPIRHKPLSFLRSAAYVPHQLLPDEVGTGILLFSKMPEALFTQ